MQQIALSLCLLNDQFRTRMKNVLYMIALGGLFLLNDSCSKNDACRDKTVQTEQAAILAYASANNITGQLHSTGIYYQVTNPGSGTTPTPYNKVFVTYTGKRMDGTVFDSQSNSTLTGWTLGGLIQGWQIGLQLIQKGGSIKLIIPSSLAYGCQGVTGIDGNSILYFDVTLVDVQ